MKRDLTGKEYWDTRYAGRAGRSGGLRHLLGDPAEAMRADMWRRLLERTGVRAGDVLELGCAPGRILIRLARTAPEHTYHGVDNSPTGLAECREALDAAGVAAAVHEGDVWMAELPRQYDVVLSAGLIEHFSDLRAIVVRHAAYARPGGWVVVTVPDWTRPWLNRAVTLALRPDTFATHNTAAMDPDTLVRAFREAGLDSVETGYGGGSWLSTVPEASGSGARLAQMVGRAWNLTSALIPPLRRCWGSQLWTIGRVPEG